MFNQSKYTKWYFNITAAAKGRKKQKGYESHHIIPASLNGTDEKSNRVFLTHREHYLCHWLLTKMVSGKDRSALVFALWAMSNQKGEFRPERTYRVPSRLYERLRKEHASLIKSINTGRKYPNRKKPTMSDEQRQQRRERLIALNKSKKGKVVSEETKEKLRQARAKQDMSYLKGKKRSPETIAKIKTARAKQTNVRNQYSSPPK